MIQDDSDFKSTMERPQERMERVGAGALSDVELLAMLLRSGTQGYDVMQVAVELLQRSGSLNGMLSLQASDLSAVRGIGKVKALQLLAVMEVARRILHRDVAHLPVLSEPLAVFTHMRALTAGLEVEKFWVLPVNRKNRLLRMVEISSGTANASLVHPREVFREAIRQAASAVICVHNHPSGDPSPSAPDIRVTRQLRQSAEVLNVDLLDHIIIGDPTSDPNGKGYYSFNEAGLI